MRLGQIAVSLISFYQHAISPWHAPCCRFVPTCSQYAKEAFATHGIGRAFLLTLWRLARCHPLCTGGFDPVPAPKERV